MNLCVFFIMHYITIIKMRNNFFILLLAVLPILSCNRDNNGVIPDGETLVSFDLKSNSSQNSMTKSLDLDVNEFSLELINSKDVIFKYWKHFAEIKGQKIPMNAGNFTAHAWYGDSKAVGFDAVYFTGETNFIVGGQESKNVNITAKQGNVAVKVVYGENIKSDYDEFWSTVKIGSYDIDSDSLYFSKSEERVGYIPAGDLYFRLNAKDKDGKLNKATKIISTQAADFITLKVDTKEAPYFDVTLTITIDASTDDRDITIEIPSLMLPSDPPTISAPSFNEGGVTFTEGLSTKGSEVGIFAEGGIKSCMLKVNSEYLLSAGWPESFDLANISEEDAATLKKGGLSWTENMKGIKTAVVNFNDISEFIKFLPEGNNESIFGITVEDDEKQSVSLDCKLIAQKAEFSNPVIKDADVWSKSVYAVSNIVNANPELIVPQIKKQDGQWAECSYTSEVLEAAVKFNITGLEVASNYELRYVYNNANTEASSFTTEESYQLGNSSFEEWRKEKKTVTAWLQKYTIENYFPYINNTEKWWDSNNNETTSKMSTPAESRYKIFPTTAWTSGRTGEKAAQIVSIAYNGTGAIKGTPAQGKLFIGTANSSGNVDKKGHELNSRPSSLEFYYKYDSYENDEFSARVEMYNNDVIIGSGEFKSGVSKNDWTLANAEINYTNTELKANKIYIIFLSSTNGTPPCRKVDVTIPEGTFNTWAGSKLVIDDLNLVYNK